MAHPPTPADIRDKESREKSLAWEAEHGVDAMARRRDLTLHVPYGRALDAEHLAVLTDSGNSQNHGLVLKAALVTWAVAQLGSSLVLTRAELEALKEAQKSPDPNWLTPASIPEWPPAR